MSDRMTGAVAPAFELEGNDGAVHKLSDHAGSPVVLYFYPKDDTPGCTREACDFRDNFARVEAAGAVVYGVSPDSVARHQKFIAKHDLNFVLLADPEKEVLTRYAAWGLKKNYGREYQGVIRSTFLIDGAGKIVEHWRNVRVKGHVDKVLAALEAL